jgi:hypothetical protein
MKANVPEKIFLHPDIGGREFIRPWLKTRASQESVEYTRTDAFIEKACEFWKDHLAGYDICDDDIERSVESFKLAMKL